MVPKYVIQNHYIHLFIQIKILKKPELILVGIVVKISHLFTKYITILLVVMLQIQRNHKIKWSDFIYVLQY